MKPYETKRLTDSPDCVDLLVEGRKSSVGSIQKKSGDYPLRGRSSNKKATRRHLKRSDKAKTLQNIIDEGISD